jgi:hypothetical protein
MLRGSVLIMSPFFKSLIEEMIQQKNVENSAGVI